MAAHGFSSQHSLERPSAAVPAAAAETVYCFSILAAAEPGVMPRVLELFAKRGLTPTRWHSDVTGARRSGDGPDLAIDIQVDGLDVDEGDYIARCLRQVFQVEAVLTSQKHVDQKRVGAQPAGSAARSRR
jgi:acetolactate synthase small subunit